MANREATLQAQALRDSAAELLQEAALTSDSAQRDALTRKALVQIDEARSLLKPSAPSSNVQPVTRLH